jgi:hypothetical protein
MEVALRRRLDGVTAIAISQGQQTADVRFAPGAHRFDPKVFRATVGEAGIELVQFDLEACGRISREGGRTWLHAGPNRFAVAEDTPIADIPTGEPVCVSGRLDDALDPARLVGAHVTRP